MDFKIYKSVSDPTNEPQRDNRMISVSVHSDEETMVSTWQDISELQNRLDKLELENRKLAFHVEELQVELDVQTFKLKMAKEENSILRQSNNELEVDVKHFKKVVRDSQTIMEQHICDHEFESKTLLRVRDEDLETINHAHNQLCISKQTQDSLKNHIEKLEIHIQALAVDTTKKINASQKAHIAETNQLKDENQELKREIRDLKLKNLELNRDVAGLVMLLKEKMQEVGDMENVLELNWENGLSRKTIRIEDNTTCQSSRSSSIWPAAHRLMSDNWCYLYQDSANITASSEDEKFEIAASAFGNQSAELIQSQRLTKEVMLKVYIYLTAAAVKYKFPDIKIENSHLVQLGENIPFWELYAFFTRYLNSLRYKESPERKSRTEKKRWFSWIRGRN